jgi:hypothetical protein
MALVQHEGKAKETMTADEIALEIAKLQARIKDLETPAPIPYPAWRYHTDGHSVIVQSEAEDKKLGAGWSDTATVKGKPAQSGPTPAEAKLAHDRIPDPLDPKTARK